MKRTILFATLLITYASCLSNPDLRTGNFFNQMMKISPDKKVSMKSDYDWYRNAVFYHIWVKGFNDSDGDGVGDLNGITQKLDYLNDGNDSTNSDLGITAIYLSPIFECYYKSTNPDVNMHGYDTMDYYKINDKFGTEEDLEKLLIEAHKRGIRIIFDWVPNHISYKHPWFLDAVEGGEKEDWFIWEKTPSKDWQKAWGGGQWTDVWHKVKNKKAYYYGLNHNSMPDLNYYNINVRTEMANTLIYWLNKGFDGVRIDQVRYLMEDGPEKAAETEDTHYFFQQLRKQVLDAYTAEGYNKMMVGEAWTNYKNIAGYYGNGTNELHMNFDFSLAGLLAGAVRSGSKSSRSIHSLAEIFKERDNLFPKGYSIGNILCNHDIVVDRPATSQKGNLQKMKLMANFLLLTPGTPFIYYGNELGMTSTKFSDDRKFRTNIDWNTFDKLKNDPDSIFNHYKKVIKWKSSNAPLQDGKYQIIESNNKKVLAYSMKKNGEYAIIVTNFDDEAQQYDLSIPDGMDKMKWIDITTNQSVKLTNAKTGILKSLDYNIYILKK